MYDENGRIMRDNFWRPDMGGTDWNGVLDRYRPILDRVATHDDLVDLLWEVQGELGTSHAYVTPRGGHGHGERQGLLGADISRHEGGPQSAALRTRLCGASTASCPPRPPTPTASPRSPHPASRCARATRSSRSPDSPSTRSPGPGRCSSVRRASPSS